MLPQTRWISSSRAHERAAERVGGGQERLARAQQIPLLRQPDQLRAVGGSGAHQALRGLEVPLYIVAGIELYDRRPQVLPLSSILG
jgi:hypothetical protein